MVKMITGDHLLIAKETARVLELGTFIRSADGLPLLDAETKAKPENLARDYGDMCLACDGFAQVRGKEITVRYNCFPQAMA